MKWIIVVLLFISTNLFAYEWEMKEDKEERNWTRFNTFNEIAFTTLVLMDMGQTLDFISKKDVILYDENKNKYRYRIYEGNPLLGKNPSPLRVKASCLWAIIIHPIISYYLPSEYRSYWQGITIGLELNAVWLNYSSGSSITAGYKYNF